MGKLFLQVFVLIFIIALGYYLLDMAQKKAESSLSTLNVGLDNTVKLSGTVTAKDDSCTKAGGSRQCYLKVQLEKDVVFVIYNYNDSQICVNEAAATAGSVKKVNDTVQAYGAYKKQGSQNLVTTCQMKDYYIQ